MKNINGLEIPTSVEDCCDPRRMALLVYDMQVGICSQVADGDAIVERVASIVTAAREAAMPIVYTRHLSMPKAWMGVTQFRTAMTWQHKEEPADVSPWFLRDSPSFEIVPALAPTADDAVFDKLAMSAFEGTPLGFALSDRGIRAVAIVGIATEIGIEPTARHATDLGFIPVIVTDACGTGHEDAARRSIESLRFAGETVFTDTASIVGLLNEQTART